MIAHGRREPKRVRSEMGYRRAVTRLADAVPYILKIGSQNVIHLSNFYRGILDENYTRVWQVWPNSSLVYETILGWV